MMKLDKGMKLQGPADIKLAKRVRMCLFIAFAVGVVLSLFSLISIHGRIFILYPYGERFYGAGLLAGIVLSGIVVFLRRKFRLEMLQSERDRRSGRSGLGWVLFLVAMLMSGLISSELVPYLVISATGSHVHAQEAILAKKIEHGSKGGVRNYFLMNLPGGFLKEKLLVSCAEYSQDNVGDTLLVDGSATPWGLVVSHYERMPASVSHQAGSQ